MRRPLTARIILIMAGLMVVCGCSRGSDQDDFADLLADPMFRYDPPSELQSGIERVRFCDSSGDGPRVLTTVTANRPGIGRLLDDVIREVRELGWAHWKRDEFERDVYTTFRDPGSDRLLVVSEHPDDNSVRVEVSGTGSCSGSSTPQPVE